MNHTCKLCNGQLIHKHTVANIPYYLCRKCNLLQNFYWEDTGGQAPESMTAINDTAREAKWPAGEGQHMYEKGWEMLERMNWPPAQWSRQLNTLLKNIPGYQALAKWYVKRKHTNILDFGCGHGISVIELAERDGMATVGIDPYSPTHHPSIIRKDLIEAHFPNEHFSGIFSIETAEHLPNPIEIFTELHRIMKPGAVLLVQTRRLEDPSYKAKGDKWFYLADPKTHIQIFSEPAMRRLAKITGFSSVTFRGVKFARFVK